RLSERGIIGGHDGLGQEAGHAIGVPEPAQLGEQRVADDVSETALRVGHRHVQRQPGDRLVVGDELRTQEDEADLGAVAGGDHGAPAGRDERADLPRRRAAVLELLGDRSALALADERVAADRDQRGAIPAGGEGRPVHLLGRLCPRLRARQARPPPAPSSVARARKAAAKHWRGARAMPAPICPIPGSRWAIPVLITGATPLSTTRRTSIPVGVPAKPRAGIAYSAFRARVMPYIARV